MSSRILRKGYANGVLPKRIRFAFRPDGTNNPSVIRDPGDMVASVVFSTTGRWTVTMRDAYRSVIFADAAIRMVSATDIRGQISGVANEGTSSALSLVVRALAGATETNISSDAQNWIQVVLDVEDSSAAGV